MLLIEIKWNGNSHERGVELILSVLKQHLKKKNYILSLIHLDMTIKKVYL
jgi:hypothetical protein